MRVTKASSFSICIIIAAALLACSAASAQHKGQASFAVAITLRAASKPLTAALLCQAGKPMDILGAAVRVTCPALADAGTKDTRSDSAHSSDSVVRPPEVTVTF